MTERGEIDLWKNLLRVGETAYLLGVKSEDVHAAARRENIKDTGYGLEHREVRCVAARLILDSEDEKRKDRIREGLQRLREAEKAGKPPVDRYR